MSVEYDLAAVRRLLLAAFAAEDVPRFCRDRALFQPACDRFGPGQGLDDMVDELLKYARTLRLLGELLAAVREHNPRQYAAFEPHLVLKEGVPAPAADTGAGSPRRGWVLVALLAADLGLLLLAGWCLFGHDPALVAYLQTAFTVVQTAFTVVGVLVAIALALLAVRRPAAWDEVLRRLGSGRRWSYVVAGVTVACLAAVALCCLGRPDGRPPTTYMVLIVDNGPVPAGHEFDELRDAVQVEVTHALPNAALALRVFGASCGQTRRVVDFETGNAADVAAALGGVPVVGQADLTEAVRQALDDLLGPPGAQPRVLVAVTWGREGCGGNLDEALARYRQYLGSQVSLNLIALGEAPAVVHRPGVSVVEVQDVQEARDALRDIHRVLESGNWSPRTPVFRVPPEATP